MSLKRKGRKLPESTKKKISEANKGKQLSQETIEKLRMINTGRPSKLRGRKLPEETKKKISESHKGEKNHQYGKHRSEEECKKISEGLKGHEVSKETRDKIAKALSKSILCIETGEIFQSIAEAERQTGNNRANLIACMKGRQKTCGGYHWKYVSDEEKQ